MSTFFEDTPEKKIFLFKNLTGCIHFPSSPHFKSLARLKAFFVNLAYRDLYRRKVWQRHEYFFFVVNPDQKFLLFRKILGCIQPYSYTHFIWTSSWLDWKTLFAKLHTDTFLSATFDNDKSSFFVDNRDRKIRLFKNLIGWIHKYYCPNSIWTSSWLDWKTLFVNVHTKTYIGAKFDIDMRNFFRGQTRSHISSVSELTRTHTNLL